MYLGWRIISRSKWQTDKARFQWLFQVTVLLYKMKALFKSTKNILKPSHWRNNIFSTLNDKVLFRLIVALCENGMGGQAEALLDKIPKRAGYFTVSSFLVARWPCQVFFSIFWRMVEGVLNVFANSWPKELFPLTFSTIGSAI